MAWGTYAERRAAVEERAKKAEAKAAEHRAREASYVAQGKHDKAKGHAATAARQERIALTHRQELGRLASRKSQQDSLQQQTKIRAREMARAQERAEAAATARPAPDPLHAYTEALETAVSLEADADRRNRNARAYVRAGNKAKAEIATRGAEVSRRRAQEWRDEAEKIQAGTDRDLARELAVSVKAKRRAESKAKIEAKRLADLGIESGLATAAAQREIASGGAGRGNKVASFRDYASLIRKPQERTRIRLETMEAFDNLCGTADAGLFPEPRFEHESGSGKGPGTLIMETRAAGLAKMEAISNGIGARNVEMLRCWIYERMTLAALVRAGFGTEKTAGKLTLAAVDALAVFLKTRDALAAQMAGMGLRSRPQPPEAASSALSADSAREGARENASPSGSPARPSRRSPESRQFWSNHLPAGDRPERPTVSCPEEISDATRRTIQELTAGTSPERAAG